MYLRTRHHFSRRPTHHSLHFVNIFIIFLILVFVKFSFPFLVIISYYIFKRGGRVID